METMSDSRRRLWSKEDVEVIAQVVPLTTFGFLPACFPPRANDPNRPGEQ